MSLDRTFLNSETYGERVAENRRECFSVITAEEDAAISARTGRARRVRRCPRCNRSVRIDTRCWFCFTATSREY